MAVQQNAEHPGSERRDKKNIIVLGVLAVIVIAVVVGLLIWKNRPKEESRQVLVTEDNIDEVIKQSSERSQTSTDRYTVTMNTVWSFADGKSESSNSYVENSTDNSRAVYFDIFLADDMDGEAIYKSPVIPVGEHIQKIKLDKELDDGAYDCVMTYHLIDDNQNTLSTVNVSLKINIGDIKKIIGNLGVRSTP